MSSADRWYAKSPSVVRAKFRRYALDTAYTKLFEDFSPDEQTEIVKSLNLESDEEIILGFRAGVFYWWMLTDFRLAISNNHRIRYIPLSEIQYADLSAIWEGRVSNEQCKHLDLVTAELSVRLELEERTWHAVVGILKFVVHWRWVRSSD